MKLTNREVTSWLKKPPFALNLGQRKHICARCQVEFEDDCGTTKYCPPCRKLTYSERKRRDAKKFRRKLRAGAPKRTYKRKEQQ